MPGGQPPKLDKVLRHDPDGKPVTVHDTIIQALRVGNYIETAAAMAGVSKNSIYDWLKNGARAPTNATRDNRNLTHYEDLCVAFSDAVAHATAAAESESVAQLLQLARGGLPQVETREKIDVRPDPNDPSQMVEVVTERVETTKHTLPSESALMWRLERRHPDRWGRIRVEVTGEDGRPIEVEVRADALARKLAELRGEELGAELGDEAVPRGEGGEEVDKGGAAGNGSAPVPDPEEEA